MTDHPSAALRAQTDQILGIFGALLPSLEQIASDEAAIGRWAENLVRLRELLLEFLEGNSSQAAAIGHWLNAFADWAPQSPLADPAWQTSFGTKCVALWQAILSQYGLWAQTAPATRNSRSLPYDDPRFADAGWQANPLLALIHQTYLLFATELLHAEQANGAEKSGSAFAQEFLDTICPAHVAQSLVRMLNRPSSER